MRTTSFLPEVKNGALGKGKSERRARKKKKRNKKRQQPEFETRKGASHCNVFYTDGYTTKNGKVNSKGGFTVFKNGILLFTQRMGSPGVTSNECELRGIEYAVNGASPGDEIVTDSMNSIYWLRSCKPKARPDLQKAVQEMRSAIDKKRLALYWRPRDENLAGIYNEERLGL